MNSPISPRDAYILGLKTVPFEELLDELVHAAKKMGKSDSRYGGSEDWQIAKDELTIVRAELTRREKVHTALTAWREATDRRDPVASGAAWEDYLEACVARGVCAHTECDARATDDGRCERHNHDSM